MKNLKFDQNKMQNSNKQIETKMEKKNYFNRNTNKNGMGQKLRLKNYNQSRN